MLERAISAFLALMLTLTGCGPGAPAAPSEAGTAPPSAAGEIETSKRPEREEDTVDQITLTFNGHTYAATLADNSSAQAFAELLQSGPLTVHMSEYGGWEKVGALGQTLPSSDVQTTTDPGDFVLYQSNSVVLFYGSNSWSYTRLGRIDDPSGLREALGDGDVEITFQLASNGD